MPEAYRLIIDEQPSHMEQGLKSWREGNSEDIALLTRLGKGVVRFATAAFPDASIDEIYAQHNQREGEGRGPHFDIYNEGLSENYPWLAVYNLTGDCGISAAALPNDMAEQYAELYPEPDEAAYQARRHYGALVLGAESSQVGIGKLKPDMGLILPQWPDGPHIIHRIRPDDPADPGSFIKLIVPKDDEGTLGIIKDEGFVPLDELLTRSIEASVTNRDGLTEFLDQELQRSAASPMPNGVGGGRLD